MTGNSAATAPLPSVFISWAHRGGDWSDGQAVQWERTVADFAYLLDGNGVYVEADIYDYTRRGVDWTRYGPDAIERAATVIMISSTPYWERWNGTNRPTEGAGVAREADTLKGLFDHDQDAFQRKSLIVVLPGQEGVHVPHELGRVPRYPIRTLDAGGIEALLRLLFEQPVYKRHGGSPPTLPDYRPAPRQVENSPQAHGRARHRAGLMATVAVCVGVLAVVLALRYPGGPEALQQQDLIEQAQRAEIAATDIPHPQFGPPDADTQRRGGYVRYADGVELQDGTRPARGVLVSMPRAATPSTKPSWLALIYSLPAPLSAGAVLDVLAGLPKATQPDVYLTYQVECHHIGAQVQTILKQWPVSGRDHKPIHERIPLSECAGVTEIRLVVVRTPGPAEITAIWAIALITPHP